MSLNSLLNFGLLYNMSPSVSTTNIGIDDLLTVFLTVEFSPHATSSMCVSISVFFFVFDQIVYPIISA